MGGVDTLRRGCPYGFCVSGDIQYVKWRKFDQIHVSQRLFFCIPGRARVCPSAGEFLSIATRWRSWL